MDPKRNDIGENIPTALNGNNIKSSITITQSCRPRLEADLVFTYTCDPLY